MRQFKTMALSVLILASTAGMAHAANENKLSVTRGAYDIAPTMPAHVITMEPGALLANRLELSYEHVLTPSLTLSVSPGVKWTGVEALDFMNDVGWVKLGAGLRWYPSGHAPSGFFASPNVSLASAWRTRENDRNAPQGVAASASMLFGYAWVVHGTLDMSLAGGVQYLSAGLGNSNGGRSMILPSAEFKIGPAF